MLGVTTQTAFTDIKKQYRKRIRQHHPDRVHAQSNGQPSEKMIKDAHEKTIEIKKAYEILKEKLEPASSI